jgi:biopolymer transport protein TolR
MARLAGVSRRSRRRPLNADVNIINLVDVMLVLLIIFMVTAPIMQGGIAVRLPKVASKPIQIPDALTITVEKSGNISIGNQHVTWNEFVTNFSILVGTKKPSGVYVRGDAAADFGKIMRVLGQVRLAGIEKVSLVTDPVAP